MLLVIFRVWVAGLVRVKLWVWFPMVLLGLVYYWVGQVGYHLYQSTLFPVLAGIKLKQKFKNDFF